MTLNKLIDRIRGAVRLFVGMALCVAGWVTEANDRLPYVLVDSGFASNDRYQPFWIDNDRLIFRGYEPGSYRADMQRLPIAESAARGYEYTGMKTGYYIWNTRIGDVSPYKDRIEDLCAEGDSVIYRSIPANAEEKSIVWRGKIGAEKPTQSNPRLLPRRNNGLPRECWNMFPDAAKDENKGRFIRRLRPEFGYLDLGPTDLSKSVSPYSAVAYYRPGVETPIELPIQRGLLRAARFHFAPHEGRYLLEEFSPDRSITPRVWFLARDGKVENVTLPDGPWSNVRLYPAKDGLFLSSVRTKGESMARPGGAYLVRGKEWRLLFRGRIGPAGVSPNGCRVALSVAPNWEAHLKRLDDWKAGKTGEQTMRMTTVCEGEPK